MKSKEQLFREYDRRTIKISRKFWHFNNFVGKAKLTNIIWRFFLDLKRCGSWILHSTRANNTPYYKNYLKGKESRKAVFLIFYIEMLFSCVRNS